ncbi:MAG: hypothetical protein RLZZ599_1475, partial [Bacteroidota bacterium]
MKSVKFFPRVLVVALLWGGAVSCQSNSPSVQSTQVEGVVNENVNVEQFADLIENGP